MDVNKEEFSILFSLRILSRSFTLYSKFKSRNQGWTNRPCNESKMRLQQQLCKRFEIRNKVFKDEKYVNGLQNNA